jgi:8-oxo-dGTP pyrophosphatase MutT (NUDIX family)
LTGTTPQIAVGLIVDDGGRLLLQLRDDRPGIANPGRWGLFGGHLEPGEQRDAAFLRELHEELGWRPRHFEHYVSHQVDAGGFRGTSHVYAAHLDVALDALFQAEGQRMAPFAPDALPSPLAAGLEPLIEGFVASDAYRRVRRTWKVLSTAALLVDRQGRFLLQHRDDKPEIENPGRWGTFGGEMEPCETPDAAFLREIEEELGWRPSRFALVRSFPYDARAGRTLIYLYAALVDVPQDQLVLGEGQGFGFFPPDALPQQIVPGLDALIREFAATGACRDLVRQPAD